MRKNNNVVMLKDLPDEASVLLKGTENIISGAELKQLYQESKTNYSDQWYVVDQEEWKPDVATFLKTFIAAEARVGRKPSDWKEKAEASLTVDSIKVIQGVLEKAFKNTPASSYPVLKTQVYL